MIKTFVATIDRGKIFNGSYGTKLTYLTFYLMRKAFDCNEDEDDDSILNRINCD